MTLRAMDKTIYYLPCLLCMFNLFKKKSELDKLQDEYKKVLEESYKLSHTNRAASDQKAVEADEIMKKIEALKEDSKQS
jgi:hypothetical protein